MVPRVLDVGTDGCEENACFVFYGGDHFVVAADIETDGGEVEQSYVIFKEAILQYS